MELFKISLLETIEKPSFISIYIFFLPMPYGNELLPYRIILYRVPLSFYVGFVGGIIVFLFLYLIVRLGKKCAGGCISDEGDGGALDLSTGESPVGDPIYLKPRSSESFYMYIGFLRTFYSSHIEKIFEIPVSILYIFKLFSHSIPKFIFLCSLNRIYFQSSGRKRP